MLDGVIALKNTPTYATLIASKKLKDLYFDLINIRVTTESIRGVEVKYQKGDYKPAETETSGR